MIAPTAPHEHEEQMLAGERGWRAWPMAWQRWSDDGFPRDDVLAFDEPRIVTTSIADCVAETRRRFAVDDRPAILLGDSEGATFAVTYARDRPAEVRACYAYAGGPYDDLMRNDAAADALGSVDLRISTPPARRRKQIRGQRGLSAYLTERDVTHTTYFTDGTHHGVTEDVIADMGAYVELFI